MVPFLTARKAFRAFLKLHFVLRGVLKVLMPTQHYYYYYSPDFNSLIPFVLDP